MARITLLKTNQFGVNLNIALMIDTTNKPLFTRRIFGDVNFEALDYDKKAAFVIERVFERGDVDDSRQCRRYYGDEIIREALTNARFLSLSTIYLASAVLSNELTNYRCYNAAQLDLHITRTKVFNGNTVN